MGRLAAILRPNRDKSLDEPRERGLAGPQGALIDTVSGVDTLGLSISSASASAYALNPSRSWAGSRIGTSESSSGAASSESSSFSAPEAVTVTPVATLSNLR